MQERTRHTVHRPPWIERIEKWVVGLSLPESRGPLFRSPHASVVIGLFVVLAVLYYGAQLGLNRCLPALSPLFSTVHDLHRALFLIPLVYTALVFRMPGAIAACGLFLVILLPRALLFSPYPDPVLRAIVFFAPAAVITVVIAALADQIERAHTARARLADLHDELAESLMRLQESEEQLIQAEKLSSLGQMAASIAHEINNPLAGVLVYIQLIAKKIAADTMARDVALEYLAKMATEIDRSSRIIRNLLDFARPSALSLGDVDVNQVIDDALALVGHRARLGQIEVVRDLQADLPKVFADYDQLRQVLVNLTLNAVQATPAGGRVTLRTQIDPDGLLRVEVEDTGTGISETNKKKLFTPFFTTKEKGQGVGLGLAVAKGIVEKHSGLISVESQEGKGTRFTVRLPVQAGGPAAAGAAGSPPLVAGELHLQ